MKYKSVVVTKAARQPITQVFKVASEQRQVSNPTATTIAKRERDLRE